MAGVSCTPYIQVARQPLPEFPERTLSPVAAAVPEFSVQPMMQAPEADAIWVNREAVALGTTPAGEDQYFVVSALSLDKPEIGVRPMCVGRRQYRIPMSAMKTGGCMATPEIRVRIFGTGVKSFDGRSFLSAHLLDTRSPHRIFLYALIYMGLAPLCAHRRA